MTVSAATICQSGVSYPTAIEIARQMNAGAGSGNAERLVASGISPQKATALAKQINDGAFDSHKLSMAGFNGVLASQIKTASGL